MDLTKEDLIYRTMFGLHTNLLKLSGNTNAGRFKFPLPYPIPWKGAGALVFVMDVSIKDFL
jgi:hypothetical protein